ncbi:MAG: hypothetical protein WC496_01655 [Phycisphaerae bacterium]
MAAIFVNITIKSANGDITMSRYDDYDAATNISASSDPNNAHGSVSFPNDIIWRYYRQLNVDEYYDYIDPEYYSPIMEPNLNELVPLPWIPAKSQFFWEMPTVRYSKIFAERGDIYQKMVTGSGGSITDKWNSAWMVYTHNWDEPGEYDITGKLYEYYYNGAPERYVNCLIGRVNIDSSISTIWTKSTLVHNSVEEVLADLSQEAALKDIVLQKGESLFFVSRYDADNGGGYPGDYAYQYLIDHHIDIGDPCDPYDDVNDGVMLTMKLLEPPLREGYDVYEHFNVGGGVPDSNLWHVYKSDETADTVENDGFSRLIMIRDPYTPSLPDKPVGVYGQQPIVADSDGNCVIECRFSNGSTIGRSYTFFNINVSPAPVRGEYSGHPPIYMGLVFKFNLGKMFFRGYFNSNMEWEDPNVVVPAGSFEQGVWYKAKLVLNTKAYTIKGYVYDDSDNLIWETSEQNYGDLRNYLVSDSYYVNIYNVTYSHGSTVYVDYVTASHSVFCGGRDRPYPAGDVNHDCKVNHLDVADMAEHWLDNLLE